MDDYQIENVKNSISIKQFGKVFDGVKDNSQALQAAVKTGKIIIIDTPIVVRQNIYLYGSACLLGKGNGKIILDGDFKNADGRKFVINCGIKSRKGENEIWTGFIKNLAFIGSDDAAFNYLIQLHNVNEVHIKNNTFDFSKIPQSSVRGDGRGCAIESLNDRGWNAGSMDRKNILISGNKIYNKQDAFGKEGIGIGHAENVVIKNNFCYGMGDDGIAIHSVENFTVSNNKLYVVDGRILVSNSQNGKIFNNYIKKIPMQNKHKGKWANSSSFISLIWEYPQRFEKSNTNIDIYNNTFVLPTGYAPVQYYRGRRIKTTFILLQSAKQVSIYNNNFVMRCDTSYVSTPIELQRTYQKTFTNKKILEIPKNVTITKNKLVGKFKNMIGTAAKLDKSQRNIKVFKNEIVN